MRSTGIRRIARHCIAGSLLAGAVLSCLAWARPAQGRSQRPKRSQEIYAIVAGTVFRDDGHTLPGAAVSLVPDPEGGAPVKLKPLSASSNSMGEFAFRVPAGPMRYTVSVKATGFKTQEKTVSVSADERADVFFQMERAQPEK
jgi:hypothetical protein